MTVVTPLEKEIVLRVFKDFTVDYNPGSIAKILNKTRAGTYKALQALEKDEVVTGTTLGKARFYQINLKDEYARKNVETLLMEEAKKHARWKDELQGLFPYTHLVLLFGSITRNEEKAHDVDVLIVFDQKNSVKVNQFIKEKNLILTKKLHLIKQTKEDLLKNMRAKDKVVIDALRTGIVLHGYENMIGVMQDVSREE